MRPSASKPGFTAVFTLLLCLLMMQNALVQFNLVLALQRSAASCPESRSLRLWRDSLPDELDQLPIGKGTLQLPDISLAYEKTRQWDEERLQITSFHFSPNPEQRDDLYADLEIQAGELRLILRDRIYP